MSRFEGLSSRQRALPAAVVAVSVLLFSMAKGLVGAAMFFGTSIAQGGVQNGVDLFSTFLSFQLFVMLIPFVLGVFAWLWLLAPMTAESRLGVVIAGSAFAFLAGTVVALVVNLVVGMQGWFVSAQFFGNSSNQAVESFLAAGGNVLPVVVQSVLSVALDALPVVVLAVVLTWSWLVRHSVKRGDVAVAVEV